MKITVLAGGVGGARFLMGLRTELNRTHPNGQGGTTAEITAVVNTGDDLWLAGLRVCPDLDSIMYALAGANDTERGWGRAGETERVSAEMTAYGVGWPWFTLGDLDLGTHIARSHWLREGLTLTQATEKLTARWPLGVRLLPATNDRAETHVTVADTEGPLGADPVAGATRSIHFEEWWVKHRAALPALAFTQLGIETARATPEALASIETADVVLIAPSNPVVSIGTILSLPGISEALAKTPAPVIGVSPIISGSAVRGMADACLRAIGVAVSAEAVARHYGSRSSGGILDAWLVDEADYSAAAELSAAGIPTTAVPLWMTDEVTSGKLAAAALHEATLHEATLHRARP
jgi:LPPG:FO 2-phospho-L-lactate transferase